MRTLIIALLTGVSFGGAAFSQSTIKSYNECNYDSLITVLRAYEDSLALESFTTVVRLDYAFLANDEAAEGKIYKIYRCEALYDSLTVLMEAVDFARATPPAVETDSISGVTGKAATFHAKVMMDGGAEVTALWFRYGASVESLLDSVAVAGTATPFSVSVSTLIEGTTYYTVGFARNAKGTSSGDTLSFTTWAAPAVDTQEASSITKTSATMNATYTDVGNSVMSTGFKYATNSSLTGATDVAGSGTTSPFTSELTCLTQATQYWAVGYVTNAEGMSYGDTITFTTSAPDFTCGTSLVSYDGHNYSTVLIGSQCWFAENLRNDNYKDGIAIPGNLDETTWSNTSFGAQAVYDQGTWMEPGRLNNYGRLYNWHAVKTGNLCPTGWHVPTDGEWSTLVDFLGGPFVAGAHLKSSPIDSIPWTGSNISGFSGLPGGHRCSGFYGQNSFGSWWSSSGDGNVAWYRSIWFDESRIYRENASSFCGYSVRCLQNPATAPTVYTQAESLLAATTATVNATYTDGGSAVTATGFKYGTDALLTSPTDVASSGTTSPFAALLLGLMPSTQYWAVGYATNGVGTSYGDTITFTTSSADPAFTCGTSMVSYDGHNYTTVQIGSQCWFAENLRNDHYKDGTAIPGNLDSTIWSNTSCGAQAVYAQGGADEATNHAYHGRLYNWHAVNTGNLCPTGWHVPADEEWTSLENALGGSSVAGTELKALTPAWDGTNTSGFSALPGGCRYVDGVFRYEGLAAYWWSSSPIGTNAWLRALSSGVTEVYRADFDTRFGYSVRCLQNSKPEVDTQLSSSVTETAANLNATFTYGGFEVTATGFKYGTDALLFSPSDVASSNTTSPFSVSLSGLTPSTQYWAVGYATNGLGTSYGDTITFTTPAFTCGTSMVSYDGHNYTTVQIGSQCWFVENLSNDNYRNGDVIPANLSDSQWGNTMIGAQSVYGEGSSDVFTGSGDEVANLATYGRLYNWYATQDSRGLCPTGWHVPTDEEWTSLENALGGSSFAGTTLKASAPAWNGNNANGFSALPGGLRSFNGYFYEQGYSGNWWSSSQDVGSSIARGLLSSFPWVSRYFRYPQDGFSVRCVQD